VRNTRQGFDVLPLNGYILKRHSLMHATKKKKPAMERVQALADISRSALCAFAVCKACLIFFFLMFFSTSNGE